MKNLGLAFYKDYFKSLKFKRIRNEWYPVFSGKTFLDRLQNLRWNIPAQPPFGGNHGFSLTTIYPGLLIGSGYIHEIGADKKDENGKPLVSDELKLGFYFDHTTGLPVIPGSSVKGVLRSAFEKDDGGYVKYLLEDKLKIKTGLNIEKLKEHIFEGKGYVEKKGQKVWDYLPMPNRDIFLDAFPVKVKNKLLGNDYITPHKDKDGRYNPLKDPTPIQFLKVMPGVTFRFEFILHDYMDENGNTLITVDNKRALFKAILKDLGIGAKTNVGYGQFKKNASKQSSSISKTIESNTDSITNTESITKKPLEKIKKREELLAKVLKNENGKITVELMVEGYTKPATFTYRAGLQPETLVIVKVNNIQGKGKNRTLQVEFKKLYNP